MQELTNTIHLLNEDANCHSIILRGAGDKSFCSGMDLQLTRTLDKDTSADWLKRLKVLYEAIRSVTKPLVCTVNGVAAGAGYQLALLTDIRIGHIGSQMGQTEINVGLASLLGAHIMEPFLGRAHTIELTLTGRLMDGEECHKLGLLNYCVEYNEIDIKALEVAQELAKKPPIAMSLTKQRFREATQNDFDRAFEMAIRLQSKAYQSGEPQRVMNSFLQKKEN